MKYPITPLSDLKRATVYDLSGGLNLSRDPRLIATNEQSDMKNVWYDGGQLKSRPEFGAAAQLDGYTFSGVINEGQALFIKYAYDSYEATINCALVDCNGNITHLNDIIAQNFQRPDNAATAVPKRYFAFCFNGEIYIAIAFHNYPMDTFYKGIFYKLTGDGFIRLSDGDFYAPLIAVNLKGDSYQSLPSSDNTVFSPASTFEGYNLLTDRVRVKFTTDGVSSTFKLPVQAQEIQDIKVRIVASFSGGAVNEYEGTITRSSAATLANGIRCYLTSQNQIKFTNSSGTALPPSSALASSNLEVEFHADIDEGREEELLYCSLYSAFGASGGVGKGNRLFLSGSEKRPNKLFWSDSDQPLYFPENNYSLVGDGTVLALHKQNDMLVILLNNSIYYATYVGTNISADDIISGAVADITVAQAIFPLTLLHGETGLYAKGCARLIGNKIYFLGSDKAVYRIDGKTSLTKISQKIEPLLNNLSGFFALSKLKNGFMLTNGSKAAVYNTETRGWYLWEFATDFSAAVSFERAPVLYDGQSVYVLSNTLCEGAYFTSPLFSFGYPDMRKRICEISLEGAAAQVGFISEEGESICKPLSLSKKAVAPLCGVKYAGFSVYGLKSASSITLKYYIFNN